MLKIILISHPEVTVVSQLSAIFDLLVQSHSPLCSFTCKAKYDRKLRPLR